MRNLFLCMYFPIFSLIYSPDTYASPINSNSESDLNFVQLISNFLEILLSEKTSLFGLYFCI